MAKLNKLSLCYLLFLDLKKRVAAAENKQKALKRKSQAFDQLMEISRAKKTATAGLMTPSPSSTPPPPSIPVAVKSTGGAPHRGKVAPLAGQTNPIVYLSKGNSMMHQNPKRTPVTSKDSNGVKNANSLLSVKLPRQVGKKKSSNVPSSSESMDESYDEEEEEDEEEFEEEEEEDEDMSEDEEEEIVYDPNDPDWAAEERKRRRKTTASTSAKSVKMAVSAKDPKVTSSDLVITTRAAKKALTTESSPAKPGQSPVSGSDDSNVVKPLRLSAVRDNVSDNVVYKLSADSKSSDGEITKEDTDCKTEVAVSSTEPSGGKDGTSTESKTSPQDKESKVSTEDHTKVTSGQIEVTSGQTEVTPASKTADNETSKSNVSSKVPTVDGKKRELIITTRAKKRALSGSQEK